MPDEVPTCPLSDATARHQTPHHQVPPNSYPLVPTTDYNTALSVFTQLKFRDYDLVTKISNMVTKMAPKTPTKF
jgi:hypothetical protein